VKSKIKVIDNFLNKEFFLQLKDLILGEHFSWFFNDYKVYKNDNDFQFTHTVIKKNKTISTFIKYINPILSNLKAKKTIQVKINLQTKKDKIYNHIFHTDVPNVTTAIFYINTNNGKTIFKNGEEVLSVENRMVIFDSNLEHTGTSHTDTKRRVLINFNYI
tara:strand:+ start:73 stop:555 length:483 start_codon:yes stop_codon:yes gene_type:complete